MNPSAWVLRAVASWLIRSGSSRLPPAKAPRNEAQHAYYQAGRKRVAFRRSLSIEADVCGNGKRGLLFDGTSWQVGALQGLQIDFKRKSMTSLDPSRFTHKCFGKFKEK